MSCVVPRFFTDLFSFELCFRWDQGIRMCNKKTKKKKSLFEELPTVKISSMYQKL